LRYLIVLMMLGFIGTASAPEAQPQALFLSGRLSCWFIGWSSVGWLDIRYHWSLIGWLVGSLIGWLVY
jgi:hypothetical protein